MASAETTAVAGPSQVRPPPCLQRVAAMYKSQFDIFSRQDAMGQPSSSSVSVTVDPSIEPQASQMGLNVDATTTAAAPQADLPSVSIPQAQPDLPPPSPSSTDPQHHSEATTATEMENGHQSNAVHPPTNESASRSDPSIGTSQPSTSQTGMDTDSKKGKEKRSWTATTLAMPVRRRSRRKSGKLNGHKKATTASSTSEKAPSTLTSSEGKLSTKRRKISFLKRVTSTKVPTT